MGEDTVFRSSLVWLAVFIVVIGLYTQSMKKMMATYIFGMFAIGGVLLPDWEFFDRPISQWTSPLSVDHLGPNRPTTPTRFRFYPIRTIIYGLVYGFAFYKWWMFILS